jgi:hypothetical protein
MSDIYNPIHQYQIFLVTYFEKALNNLSPQIIHSTAKEIYF